MNSRPALPLVCGGQVHHRAIVVQSKTGQPVQFELMDDARASLLAWLDRRGGTVDDYVFPSRIDHTSHMSTRQYARLVDEWMTGIGLHREDYGTHSLCVALRPPSSTKRPATFVPCKPWRGRRRTRRCSASRSSASTISPCLPPRTASSRRRSSRTPGRRAR